MKRFIAPRGRSRIARAGLVFFLAIGFACDSGPLGHPPSAAAPIALKVNFQDAATPVPPGYVRDFGQPYGPRTAPGQGSGLTYGWVAPGTHTPRDLSAGGTTPGNGRRRNLDSDPRLDTLMHMQANDVPGFNGTPLPGTWEVALPNGSYTVTVAVGDPFVGGTPESHTINVEGTNAINHFVSTGAAGASTRHKTASVTVTVANGLLTLDASGGTNTKIDYVDIAATAVAPTTIKVNFQDAATVPPTGYVRDFGEPYGPRTAANEGSGLTYGWVQPGTTSPLNLVGNGRDRVGANPDVRQATLMHMQGNDVLGFNGTLLPGSWAVAVPNGAYTVTVSAGDAAGATDSVHQINIGDQNAIAAFVPTGTNPFATATRTVVVADGRLTINAIGGRNTKIDYADIIGMSDGGAHPSVLRVAPANLATNVPLTVGIAADVRLPTSGIDGGTLTATTARLTRVGDGAVVATNRNTSGGGDVIVLQPTAPLAPNTTYRFDVTSGLKDLNGVPFLPWSSVFTTGMGGGGGSGIAFTPVATGATGRSFTSVTKGPDGKLYAGTLTGEIVRFPINADGTLGTGQVITTVQQHDGGNRTVLGLTFDPGATASNPILWITDNYQFTGAANVPDWSSKIVRLSGANLETARDYVVGLPRSVRDHETNSIAFGPDGAMYITQGSNTAMGAPDGAWGNRPEHALNAAVLRLDLAKLGTALPLDVQTEEGGTYDPLVAGAPLTIYASGVRNAFDLVWHSNGHLYLPTNGSAAGGNAPGTPTTLPAACQNRVDLGANGPYTGPSVPGIANNAQTEEDWVFNVVQGGYYGHPNPARCEWAMNGANPTSGADPFEVGAYPVGTRPDRNYRSGGVYDLGAHYSPDGAIEYKGNAFGGALNGKLLVVRYSVGKDIIALSPDGPNGTITAVQVGITGLTGFNDPLDVTEDTATGNLYVTELSGQKIDLLRPTG